MGNGLISFFLAACAGLLVAFQGAMNTMVSKEHGTSSMILGLSIGQTVAVVLWMAFSGTFSLTALSSPIPYLAGALGVAVVGFVAYSIGAIGGLGAFVLVILGQLAGSMLLDHFGLFGLQAVPINWGRILGVLLVMAGVGVILRS